MGTIPQQLVEDYAEFGMPMRTKGLAVYKEVSTCSGATQRSPHGKNTGGTKSSARFQWAEALRSLLVPLLCLLTVIVVAPQLAAADAKTSYLVRLLESSSQFRVRAQAALSLGSICDSPEAEKALIGALSDSHPAVRAAAANSLGRIGTEKAVTPLRAVASDSEAPVRTAVQGALAALAKNEQRPAPSTRAAALYYVALGSTGSTVPEADKAHLSEARTFLRRKLAEVEGVEVAPENESPQQAKRTMERRKLTGYYLEGSVNNVQQRPGGGTRVAVSLVLSTYPDRNMRAILRGAATAAGSGSATFQQALEGAFAGAIRQLPQALGR